MVVVLEWWVVIVNLVLLFSVSNLVLFWDTRQSSLTSTDEGVRNYEVRYIKALGLWKKRPQLHTGFLYKACEVF